MSSEFLGRENGRKAELFTEEENTGGAKLWESLELSLGHVEISIPLRLPSRDDE